MRGALFNASLFFWRFVLRRGCFFRFGVGRLLADDRGDGLQFFRTAEIHQLHAHGIAADDANLFHARPNHLAFGRDQHEFVFISDGQRADDLAGFLTGLHRDDAFAATSLPTVIIERRAFADAVFAG